ncbi:MAG: TetR/AcrR family transcriptional regulator, partial [Phycisphaerales bacterium]
RGLEGTSTRDIAAAAKIATGTLFNYFPSKEALAVALVADIMEAARERSAGAPPATTPEEELFTLIAGAVRSLEPTRAYFREVLETGLSPMAAGSLAPEAERIRTGHLEDVAGAIAHHGLAGAANAPTMHLYWALFLAILSYWAADNSPGQEDTRALIDQTVSMFVGSLRANIAQGRTVAQEIQP